jgi:hypothetical protein
MREIKKGTKKYNRKEVLWKTISMALTAFLSTI